MQPLSNRALLGGLGLLGATLTLAAAQELQPRMGEPLRGLSAAEIVDFEVGLVEFSTILTIEDGLGPIFNESGCGQCHISPAIGGFGDRLVTRFGKKATDTEPFDPLEHLGGSLLQSSLIQGFDPEIYADKIPDEADVIAQRLTPQTFGMGLIEAIPDAQILANIGSSPNVNGIPRWVTPIEGGASTPSRFGWKGGVATVMTFSIDASLNELGLTSVFLPNENAPQGNQALLAVLDSVPDPEDVPGPDGKTRIDRQTDFQRFLAAPPQTPKTGMTGETIFDTIGCADCHVPSYTTESRIPSLDGHVIRPYTDFLLHDMGHPDEGGLGDGIVDGIATESMMFTRHLWGLAARTSLLHDGRATGLDVQGVVDLAIDWHRGDANFSRLNYQALAPTDREHVANFLMSLGRTEFDWDNNYHIDIIDWFFLEPYFQGPDVQATTPDDPQAVADLDQSGTLDLRDFLGFQRAITQ